MNISIRKSKYVLIMIVILIVQLCFTIPNVTPDLIAEPDTTLIFISRLCVISFIIEIIIWIKLTGEFFSPYMVFFLVLFAFSCGQSIGWATDMEIGKDLWSRTDHGLNRRLLTTGLCYSMMAVGCFHLGAIIKYSDSPQTEQKQVWNSEVVIKVYQRIGKLFLLLIIPAFIAKAVQDVTAVANGGYEAVYTVNSSSSFIMRIFSILEDYYQPCMLILLIGNREDSKKRKLIVFFMIIDVVISLYIGGRSGAVMTGLGILLAYHYFVRPFKTRQIIPGVVGGYIGVAILNTIALTRGNSGRGITDIFLSMGDSFSNVLGDFVGELGWTLTSVCWTMNLIPSSSPFRYGLSYLVSLIAWIPSFVFGGKVNHPVVVWGNLGDWLAASQNMSYGPGYTTVAESYINFGWYGLIVMVFEGMILCKLLASIKRNNVENNIFGATFQTLIIMILMKSIVRSSLSAAMRSVFFVLIPLYLLLHYNIKKEGDSK